MPSVRQSARPNLQDWKPAPATPPPADKTVPFTDPTARSPYMIASMPLMASTGDAFARQFYGAGNVPSQRILPAKRGAGA
jgi:hypothetical protein